MILAVLDDLLFRSKIRTTAAHVGSAIGFARSADDALAEMRKSSPAMVILDLDNPRINALALVEAMKADAALMSIPLVGFGSHVQVEMLNAARRAGVDEVLARSAFAERLAEILRRAGPSGS